MKCFDRFLSRSISDRASVRTNFGDETFTDVVMSAKKKSAAFPGKIMWSPRGPPRSAVQVLRVT